MTPDEQQLIYTQAEEIFSTTVSLMVALSGYGAFVLGFIITVQLLTIRGSSRGRPQTILLACLVASLICFTWTIFSHGGTVLMNDLYAFMQTLEQGIIAQTQAANKKHMIWWYMFDWPVTTSILLSDGIVVWRAWCLFQQHRFWRLMLATCMIANIGINVADCIWADVRLGAADGPTILDWLSAAFSLVVNMVATILVAYTAWTHHRDMAALNGSLVRKGTRGESILILLIESGAIFCAIQSLYIIILGLHASGVINSRWPAEITVALLAVASACYPVTVITLVPRCQ
ncbi:hypothetical protein BDP27DRAFT_1405224, partial [Rhodocollybia butyracea]